MTTDLAERITEAREQADMSPELLAGTIGVSLATLRRYERGHSIHVQTLERIAQATGKPLDWFLTPA